MDVNTKTPFYNSLNIVMFQFYNTDFSQGS